MIEGVNQNYSFKAQDGIITEGIGGDMWIKGAKRGFQGLKKEDSVQTNRSCPD